ncbi:MAG: hypothetical protein JWR07_1950 [Nevskia sp.]|nr:hypothetical protein [Nevskia sp.]
MINSDLYPIDLLDQDSLDGWQAKPGALLRYLPSTQGQGRREGGDVRLLELKLARPVAAFDIDKPTPGAFENADSLGRGDHQGFAHHFVRFGQSGYRQMYCPLLV